MCNHYSDSRLDHCRSNQCKNTYAYGDHEISTGIKVKNNIITIILMVYHTCLLGDGYSTSAISLSKVIYPAS